MAPRRAPGDDFRAALRELAGGVSIVTTRLGARRTGCVVSSLTSYSLEPPTLLLTLARNNSTSDLLLESGGLGVSLISARLRETAHAFARAPSGEARFAHGSWRETTPGGQWVIEGALAAFECRVEETIARHTHLIVLARVLTVETKAGDDADPLLYWRRDYRRLS